MQMTIIDERLTRSAFEREQLSMPLEQKKAGDKQTERLRLLSFIGMRGNLISITIDDFVREALNKVLFPFKLTFNCANIEAARSLRALVCWIYGRSRAQLMRQSAPRSQRIRQDTSETAGVDCSLFYRIDYSVSAKTVHFDWLLRIG